MANLLLFFLAIPLLTIHTKICVTYFLPVASYVHLITMFVILWVPQLFERLEFSHVNKSCKIECCGYRVHKIVQNMILSTDL